MNISPRREFSDGQGYINSTVLLANGVNRERLHRVIAARVLGRPLPRGAVVHHVDDDGTNNSTDNLIILQNQAEHVALHYRRTVRRAGGDPFRDLICDLCRGVVSKAYCVSGGTGSARRCRRCHAAYWRRRYGTDKGRWPLEPPA